MNDSRKPCPHKASFSRKLEDAARRKSGVRLTADEVQSLVYGTDLSRGFDLWIAEHEAGKFLD
jgi:hypothetical protein